MESELLEKMGVESEFSGFNDGSGSSVFYDMPGTHEWESSMSSGVNSEFSGSSESSETDDKSGFPSKKFKIGEESGFEDGMEIMEVNPSLSVPSEFSAMPLLSSLSEMNYLSRRYGGNVKFNLEELRAKYILFCCFNLLPINDDNDFDISYPEDLATAYSKLYTLGVDFEMVVVMKFAENNNHDVAFAALLSKFPSHCLVVPVEELNRRNSMCQYLGLVCPGSSKFLLVNVERNIMIHGHPHITEHLQKLVEETPYDFHRCRELIQKNVWPVIPEEQDNPPLRSAKCLIAIKFGALKPEYPDCINRKVSELRSSCPIQIDQSLDVISLLSGKGEMNYLVRKDGNRVEVKRETFSGKYIMICCFLVPVFCSNSDAYRAQALATICSDLYSTRNDFEMVVVLKMNNLANYEMVFDHFLSGFPGLCLVVPFLDSERRDFICKYLGLIEHYSSICLILDKSKDIKRNILVHGFPVFVPQFGADAFPFTDDKLEELETNDETMWNSPATAKLEGLLGCNPSDVLDRFNSAGVREQVRISDLNKKVVGLYYYARGNLFHTLKEVHQQCLTRQLEFEVVLVYIPCIADCLDPHVSMAKIESSLLKQKISWWWLPFNSSVSCRLMRCMYCSTFDKLIIVGAQCEFVEPYGGEVMCNFRINAYPFTRKNLVQRELDKFKKLTLESLLSRGPQGYVLKNREKFCVEEDLKGKNIILFLDALGNSYLGDALKAWYIQNHKDDSDFDVVYVRRHESIISSMGSDSVDLDLSAEMPWYVCPFDRDHSAFVEKNIFPDAFAFDTLVEFDKNGLVCSLYPHENLLYGEPGGFQFGNSNLRVDITMYFACYLGECMDAIL